MKIFLDANVIFSGANPESALHQLLFLASKRAMFITSAYAFEEASRNLALKRPEWKHGLHKLEKVFQVVEGIDREISASLPEKDRPILATAIAENCQFLVTGDKRDFGHLFEQTIQDVTILSPLQLAHRYKRAQLND